MNSSSAMQRRMAALFLLAIGLIAWQAPLTKPSEPLSSVQATGPGEQLYPIAVPGAAPIPLPARFLESMPQAGPPPRPAVAWSAGERQKGSAEPPPGRCDLLLRVSRYHWARRSLTPGHLSRLLGGSGSGEGTGGSGAPAGLRGERTYHLAARDFADDDDGDGDLLDPGELRLGPPGAEVVVECPPPSSAVVGPA